MTQPAQPVVAVAVSGGRDSTALFHATARAAKALGLQVVGLHVHHGLQPEADAWVRHLRSQSRRWARAGWPVTLQVRRLTTSPAAGESVEAWARRERYAALAAMATEQGASLLLLAQHRRDQAETVVLQSLRGAGVRGLAAMPRLRQGGGVQWARPWLEQGAEAIAAYVERHRLSHIEDPSNQDLSYARNRLRAQVWPGLLSAFPGAESSFAKVAEHSARAAAVLAEVSLGDRMALTQADGSMDLRAWARLSDARRWYALQAWLQAQDPRLCTDVLVTALTRALAHTGPGTWPFGLAHRLCWYRGRLSVDTFSSLVEPPPMAEAASLPTAGRQALAGWRGHVEWQAVEEGGLVIPVLQGAIWRAATGQGEQFQRAPGTPPRALKKQFQWAGVPAWARQAPVLADAQGLLWVHGLGADARRASPPGAPQWLPRWISEGPNATCLKSGRDPGRHSS